MKIAVGSTNPVKIEAVRSVVQRVWPEAHVTGIAVPSGVSEMPLSEAEMIAGAKNRAILAREKLSADLGFGLEGGLHEASFGWELQGWVAVVDDDGRSSIGSGTRLPLPHHLVQRVLAGAELGHVMDDLLGETNVKQKGGAIGALTGGLIMRQDAFTHSVIYALAPFLAPEFYATTP
ncbi:MAG: inosine/xanthosine triphosphatase [Ardenticatenaceae bacterium]|nr:inosine/xanthosine triphosphatase [Ardenticatenaceae bacterium]